MNKRRKAVFWTIILSAIIGLIDLPLPAEDAYRAVRADLRAKAPPQNIVLVEIDDRTLRELERKEPTRTQNALLVETLFGNGAKKVVFDRAFADPSTAADDNRFATALKKYGANVRLGASPPADNRLQHHLGLLPNAALLPSAHLASMMGESSPFDLSARFPTETLINGRQVPSISAFLADYRGREDTYRPDFAFDVKQVPTVNFADIIQGRVSETDIAGKSFIVAETHLGSTDFHNLPMGKRIPGAYFHIIAAHTLAGGLPADLGWIPAVLAILIVVAVQSTRRRPSRRVFWASVTALAFVPLALDLVMINLDIMPAFLGLVIGYQFLSRIARKQYTDEDDFMRVSALAAQDGAATNDVIALKIRNLGALYASFPDVEHRTIIAAVTDRIAAFENNPSFGFENNAVIWLSPELGDSELENHALGLHALFHSGITIGSETAHFSVRLGIDTNHELAVSDRVQNAVQCAEDAGKGASPVKVADGHYLADQAQRSAILAGLDAALEARTIGIAYQPKVMIKTGHIFGAEALLRWIHPQHGEVSAQKIVELAEEHGRIAKLTEYVLSVALKEARAAIALDPRFKLAINISAASLADDLFVAMLDGQLKRQRFPAGNLMLEVTETSPLEGRKAADTFSRLRAMGIQLSIDDFGTGQSNLDYLQRIPSSEIKIDRSFVTNVDRSSENAAVVRATIAMAEALERSVIAEGVETKEVASFLLSLGCQRAQGFLYSGAVPIRQLLAQLHRGRLAA